MREIRGLRLEDLSIGLIPDGNRRWAAINGVSIKHGYLMAAKNVAEVISHLSRCGLKNLVIYGASHENVKKRDEQTLHFLVDAFLTFMSSPDFQDARDNVDIELFGNIEALERDDLLKLKSVETVGARSDHMRCVFVFNYSISWDIAVNKDGANSTTSLNSDRLPSLDLVIRTANARRLSDFIPHKCSYSELYFLEELWPDIKTDAIDEVIKDFFSLDITRGR